MAGRVPTDNQSGKKQSVERQPVHAVTAINRLAGSDPERVALRHGADELTNEALRSRSDALADIIRFFLNMVPIRVTIDGAECFAAHATRIHGLVSDAFTNSAYPFGWMVRDSRLCREPGRSPIHVMFNMYSEADEPLGQDELALTSREYDTGYVKFDLTLYAQDQGDEIGLQAGVCGRYILE
ncbi:HxxPF-repeated domain-containing protein [Bradyrhizobium sp. Rc3b]|uniref:condensation domain-containing protein n=1 Tax=Bradyrhizobium sp. Rc3b TaxID=1855322 RepID=UPI0008F1C1E8|nr:condensation domain-containing protein [Bradyrhizobium sp. Rc3b]SFN93984.1 HxxPF-repeated domain-containing protein [Bradyrhizobium sp. Rc3b]